MAEQPSREAWIAIPTDSERRAQLASGTRVRYDWGFLPAMGRLMAVHERIGPAAGALFHEIMFAPGALERWEREMIAAVSAAAQDCHY
jgi:alkylhydroperoxidase/carboxymuconolactone decarboxylase family protein YurZ